jgi:hypothetical protein
VADSGSQRAKRRDVLLNPPTHAATPADISGCRRVSRADHQANKSTSIRWTPPTRLASAVVYWQRQCLQYATPPYCATPPPTTGTTSRADTGGAAAEAVAVAAFRAESCVMPDDLRPLGPGAAAAMRLTLPSDGGRADAEGGPRVRTETMSTPGVAACTCEGPVRLGEPMGTATSARALADASSNCARCVSSASSTGSRGDVSVTRLGGAAPRTSEVGSRP